MNIVTLSTPTHYPNHLIHCMPSGFFMLGMLSMLAVLVTLVSFVVLAIMVTESVEINGSPVVVPPGLDEALTLETLLQVACSGERSNGALLSLSTLHNTLLEVKVGDGRPMMFGRMSIPPT